ncbi:GMP/IMP nucleotidase, partial [Serratia marcescens]
MVPEFDWPQIDTVLLDMDGTLLDLEFDSHFWLSLVPQALSERRAIPFDEARNIIEREYQAVQHTMNWYCVDYW